MSRITVSITDDHSVVIESLQRIINDVPGLYVIHTSNDGLELLNYCSAEGAPDVALIDLEMDGMDGFKASEEINKLYPNTKVIALTGHKERNYIARMIRAHASGYVLKSAGIDEVIDAIKKAANGGLPFNNEAIEVMRTLYQDTEGNVAKKSDFSEREMEVIDLICKEYSTSEIADKLYLSESTISSHKKNIFAKMKVKNTIGLAIYAFTHGLLD